MPPFWLSRTTSPWCLCRHIHPSATPSIASGSTCANASSRSRSGQIRTPSSTHVATPGMLWPQTLKGSSASPSIPGSRRSFHRSVGITGGGKTLEQPIFPVTPAKAVSMLGKDTSFTAISGVRTHGFPPSRICAFAGVTQSVIAYSSRNSSTADMNSVGLSACTQ